MKAATLPASFLQRMCMRVCARDGAVSLSARGMEEGTKGDDIISLSISWRCFVRRRQGGRRERKKSKLSHHLRGSQMPIRPSNVTSGLSLKPLARWRVRGSSPALWLLLPIDGALGAPDGGRLWRSGSIAVETAWKHYQRRAGAGLPTERQTCVKK